MIPHKYVVVPNTKEEVIALFKIGGDVTTGTCSGDGSCERQRERAKRPSDLIIAV